MGGRTGMSGIPKGYKKTDVGVIPEEWEVWELRQVCNMKSGSSITSEKIRPVGNFPCYGGNGLRGYTFTFNHEGTYPLIGRQGALCGNVNLVTGKFYASEHAVVVTCKCNISPYWLFFILERMELNQYTEASAQPGLSVTKVIKLSIPHPPLPEQKAIAEALSDMDALIEAQKELIAKKRDIKQGTMQDLLSGRVRLPGYETKGWKHTDIGDIPNDWEVSQIGKIADIISGGTPKTTEKSFWNGTILWCTPTDITRTSGRYIENTEKTITDNGLKNSSAILLPINSLLLCSRATVGDVRIAKHEITTNQGFKSLVCNSSAYYLFIYYLIPFLKPKMLEKSYGSTFLEISKSNLASIQIQLPSYIEQKTIAETLSDMDDEIETLEAELKKLNHMKRGMMQELLTGRIRLI